MKYDHQQKYMTLGRKVGHLIFQKKSGVFSCSGLFHNFILECHIINISSRIAIKTKTPSLNFHFETYDFKKFCHFFFWSFSCTDPPSDRASHVKNASYSHAKYYKSFKIITKIQIWYQDERTRTSTTAARTFVNPILIQISKNLGAPWA